jgi:hypothetical protein
LGVLSFFKAFFTILDALRQYSSLAAIDIFSVANNIHLFDLTGRSTIAAVRPAAWQ